MVLARMSVTRRLQWGFGAILFVLGLVALVSINEVRSINEALNENSAENVPIQRYAINFRGSAHDRSIAIRDVVLAADPASRQAEVKRIDELAKFYADSAAPLEALINAPDASPELARLYKEIQAIEQKTVATTKAIMALVDQGDVDTAQARLRTDAKPQYEQWLAAVNKLIDYEEKLIQERTGEAANHASRFMGLIGSAVLASLLIGATLAWRISRSILAQLGAEPAELEAVTRRMADGDLSPVPGAQQATQGSVLASLAAMQGNLAALVGQVRAAASSVSDGSAQIAAGNADLSHRTEVQASNLQQTAASMHQLSETVRVNADTADRKSVV